MAFRRHGLFLVECGGRNPIVLPDIVQILTGGTLQTIYGLTNRRVN